MVLFFGVAAKEVTESCLPGGSLNPPRKALSPLVATLGGVVGPIAVYLALTAAFMGAGLFDGYTTLDGAGGGSSHRRLALAPAVGHGNATYRPVTYGEIAHGWGVPTATDISLAWVVAAQVRGALSPKPQRAPLRARARSAADMLRACAHPMSAGLPSAPPSDRLPAAPRRR